MGERFQLIAETISEVFWIAGADGRVTYVSPAYERIWGRSPDALYADPRSFLEAVHPEDRERLGWRFDAARPASGFDHEYRIIKPGGEVRWIWGRGYAVRGDDGQIAHFVGAAQDITERKRMESELADSVERFRLVSQATLDGVFDWDMRTQKAWWSDAMYSVFGMDRASAPSFEAWSACVHPEDRERVLASFQRAIERHEPTWSDEYRFVRPDGRVLEVYDRAYVLLDADGKPVRVVGAMMDITARRRLEGQLRQAQKMEAIGQLAGGIAHDFNNILQAALLEVSLLQRAALPEGAAARVAEIRSSLDRAKSLTHQLLVFSRREAMRPQRVDLNARLVDLARMLRRLIGEDIALQLELAPGVLAIDADPGMLDQVLINLAVNARDAMPRGGTLALSTTVVDGVAGRSGRYARIAVRDTGVGITREQLPHLFEPFFTTKDATRGTGLGLATVHGIVEQHHGWIEVASELGHGATFGVYLPACDPGVAPELGASPVQVATGDETILLVEDEPSVRRALRALLEDSGYQVVDAERGAAALAYVEEAQRRIDLVITDLVMPDGMSGADLATRIAATAPDLPVVFMTGYSRDVDRVRVDPRCVFLQKPVDADQLLAVVRRALDRA
ncbi:MAG TPA: PAS domain-containing protein [Kofleriaceae bacterium]|nr:PAS domain-containing protein [Kofleriaceae bacterium]